MKVKRLLQLITGFHQIHDPYNSYGWKLPFLSIALSTKYGFFKLKKGYYHNCTLTGIY